MIIKMLNKLRRMDEHHENFNKELENTEKNRTEVKNTITEIKNTLESIKSRVDDTEERISGLEDRVVEITQGEHKKEKRILKNEDSLRDLWDNIKHPSIHIIKVQEGGEREKDRKLI